MKQKKAIGGGDDSPENQTDAPLLSYAEESQGTTDTQSAAELPKKKKRPIWADLILLVIKLTLIVAFLLGLFTIMFGITQVSGNEMTPALCEGDLVIFYRLDKDYAAGDLVAVDDGGKSEIRRVVAVAGDTVDFNENGMLIGGYLQSEEHIYKETLPYKDGITYPVTLKQGQVFVLGDDRPSSRDSRNYGAVDINSGTYGKVMTVIRRRNF